MCNICKDLCFSRQAVNVRVIAEFDGVQIRYIRWSIALALRREQDSLVQFTSVGDEKNNYGGIDPLVQMVNLTG